MANKGKRTFEKSTAAVCVPLLGAYRGCLGQLSLALQLEPC